MTTTSSIARFRDTIRYGGLPLETNGFLTRFPRPNFQIVEPSPSPAPAPAPAPGPAPAPAPAPAPGPTPGPAPAPAPGPAPAPFNLNEVLANEGHRAVITEYAEREVAAPLKRKNQELLDKLTKYKTKNDKGEEVYIDPDEAVGALKKVKEGIGTAAEEVARARQEGITQGQVRLDAANARVTQLEGQLATEKTTRRGETVKNEVANVLNRSGVKPGKAHLHEAYLRGQVKVDDTDGTERTVVLDEAGKPRYGAKGLMTVTEFIEEYKKKEGVAEDWAPTVHGGSGGAPGAPGGAARPGGGAAVGPAGVDISKLSPEERMKMFRRGQIRNAP